MLGRGSAKALGQQPHTTESFEGCLIRKQRLLSQGAFCVLVGQGALAKHQTELERVASWKTAVRS